MPARSTSCMGSSREGNCSVQNTWSACCFQQIEGPNMGITIDTERGELHLPANKLIRLQQTIRYWVSKRSCTMHELLSLIGQLQHAATVVRQGRTYLRRMIDLAACFSRLDHHIRLNAQFRSDLQWWSLFLPD